MSTATNHMNLVRNLVIGTFAILGTVSYANGQDASPVHPVTGVPNYGEQLFGDDHRSQPVRSNYGYDDFGPNPNGGRGGESSNRGARTLPAYDHDNLWQGAPAGRSPTRDGPSPAMEEERSEEPTGRELINLKLSSRYGNPVVERFVKSTSVNQFANLVLETSRLIDSRHVQPTTYQVRVNQAVENLKLAIRNPEFQRVFGLRISGDRASAFDTELDRYMASQAVRNSNDMLRVMSGVAAIAGWQAGVPASAVAAEFIYGATESLDKYSAFNPEAPAGMPSASTGLENSIVGIGVEIQPHDGGIQVLKALRNSPAEKAGLQRGDLMVRVNGQNLEGRTMDFAVDQISGPAGSPVLIDLVRGGRPIQLSVRRAQVRVYSVNDAQMLDPKQKIGYVKIDKFAEATSQELDEALWSLWNQGMQSLVLDLRGNPGGLLTTAIEVSDKFLPGGTIVSTKGRNADDNMMEAATREKTWKVPLVVLVDENSASASEIFAAAIQENGRGLIVGRRSYGKGTVQTHFPLSTVQGNLKITTARFFSPKGRVMAEAGVTPDVPVKKMAKTKDVLPLMSEHDIQTALQVAAGNEVRDMAKAATSGQYMSQR